jgi:protease-4
MKKFLKWFAVISIILLLFIFVLYLFIDALLDTEPYVSKNSYLTIRIEGDIPEYEPPDAIEDYLRGPSLDIMKIRQSFKLAEVDDRIKGILLQIGFVRTGFAKLQEIQQLIKKFRLSGKKVLAHLDYGMTRDYYLASACDSVFISPGGTLFLTGLAGEITFYKGLLKKIGVEADFEHVGEYKNAPEIYTHQYMSDQQREVVNLIFDTRFESLISTISLNRNLERARIAFLIENISVFTPEESLIHGLIDGVKYRSEMADIFYSNNENITEVSAGEYASIDPASLGLAGEERIAVIVCSGSIMDGEDGSDPYFGQTMGANRVIRDINRAVALRSVKAIILRIDSPGGSSLAADKIWFAVKEAAGKKPVIASISDLGASGGYYIAVPADTILAQDLSLVGSIGVYVGKFSLMELYQKLDLNIESIKRGKNSALFSLSNKFSTTEREIIRHIITDFYHKFVTKVATDRHKSYDEIDRIARGRVWNGADGLKFNLIDVIGGLDEAVEIARDLAGIEIDANIRLLYFPRSRSFLDRYLGNISVLNNMTYDPLGQLEKYIKTINMQPLMMMPFQIEAD